jgi:hypothetical protein
MFRFKDNFKFKKLLILKKFSESNLIILFFYQKSYLLKEKKYSILFIFFSILYLS